MSENTELEADVGGVNIFDEFDTDTDAEENGKWFEDVRGDGSGISLKIRYGGSQVAAAHLQKLLQANRRFQVKGKLPADLDKRLLVEHVAHCVLVDWKGVNGRDGMPLPYSKEMALEVLTKLPRFRELVSAISQRMDLFRHETKEEIAKN